MPIDEEYLRAQLEQLCKGQQELYERQEALIAQQHQNNLLLERQEELCPYREDLQNAEYFFEEILPGFVKDLENVEKDQDNMDTRLSRIEWWLRPLAGISGGSLAYVIAEIARALGWRPGK